jgi:outer membrane protein assembly factor BamB
MTGRRGYVCSCFAVVAVPSCFPGPTLTKLWDFGLGPVTPPVIGADNRVYMGGLLGGIYVADSITGHERLAGGYGRVTVPVAVGTGDLAYVCTSTTVYAMNITTYRDSWEVATPQGPPSSVTIATTGALYLTAGPSLYALAGTSGSVQWVYNGTVNATTQPSLTPDESLVGGVAWHDLAWQTFTHTTTNMTLCTCVFTPFSLPIGPHLSSRCCLGP